MLLLHFLAEVKHGVFELLPDSLEMSMEHSEFLFRIPYMNVYDFFLML